MAAAETYGSCFRRRSTRFWRPSPLLRGVPALSARACFVQTIGWACIEAPWTRRYFSRPPSFGLPEYVPEASVRATASGRCLSHLALSEARTTPLHRTADENLVRAADAAELPLAYWSVLTCPPPMWAALAPVLCPSLAEFEPTGALQHGLRCCPERSLSGSARNRNRGEKQLELIEMKSASCRGWSVQPTNACWRTSCQRVTPEAVSHTWIYHRVFWV